MGRKQTPTALKILKGNPGHRPINKNEPKFPASTPTPPAILGREGKREWRRIHKLFSAVGLITEADRTALALYCQAFEKWWEAARHLKEEGSIIKAPSGYPIINPWESIEKNAKAEMRSLISEFGMTPASRSKLKPIEEVPKTTPSATKKDSFSDFQKRKKKKH